MSTLASPSIKTAVTRLMLDQSLPFGTSSIGGLNVHYAMSDAGTVHAPLKDTLAQTDPVHVPGLLDPPRAPVTQLAFEDAHGEAVVAAGIMDAVARSATPDSTPGWGRELAQPVLLNGNAFLAMRGESVARETLGAGDAAQPSQRFRLKKKPLTYVPAANIAGRVSTLVIRVGGILWAEVASFYGQPADAMVYVVRHDEQGETDVEIGGAGRPPTGAPIVASYRFGGGAAVPPAGSVKQVARPVVGLRGARNPLAAFGGADAEGPLEVASRGPGSALLLGRVVSLIDFETAALERSGVRAARAAWRWDEQGQRPAVVLRYLGDAQLAPSIRAALRALAEEDAPIAVLVSPAQPARLDVEIETDPRLDGDMVADAVRPSPVRAGVAARPWRAAAGRAAGAGRRCLRERGHPGDHGRRRRHRPVRAQLRRHAVHRHRPRSGRRFLVRFRRRRCPCQRAAGRIGGGMGTARDLYREYYTERLWDWVPPALREADAIDGGDALRALLRAFASQAAVLKRSQDRLWDDVFIELADDWAVPYIAQLLGTRLVSALNPRARRSDVAKTIYYRRRKGTVKVLEQLCDDVAGWDAKLVEQFHRLARARHGLDGPAVRGRVTGTPEGGLADLRSVRGTLLAGGPFDELHYTPETRRPAGLLGIRGIQTLAFHLHRLDVVELAGVTPRRINDLAGTRDGYTFDPSGREVPLFASGVERGDWSGWRPATEGMLPVPIDCRLFNERIFAASDASIAWILTAAPIATLPARQAAAADLAGIAGQRIAGEAAFRRVLAGLPSGATLADPGVAAGVLERSVEPDSGSVVLAGTVSVGVPLSTVPPAAMRAADLSSWPIPSPAGVDLLFDPDRGRFLFDPAAAAPETVQVGYAVGMCAPIGAGAAGRSIDSAAATAHWALRATTGGVPANGVLELDDSSTFVAPPDQTAITDLRIRAAEARRPFVRLSADWRLGASGDNRLLTIDGLWIGAIAGRLRLQGSFARVELRHCTLDQGGLDAMGGTIPPCGLVVFGNIDELVIERSNLPGIALGGANAGIDRVVIRDSIVDASRAGATGIALPRSHLVIERSTVIAPAIGDLVLDVERLDAGDTLVAGIADVTDLQSGCFRFSARAPGSRVPHPYESHVVDDLQRLFVSRRFGDPHYAELSPRAPEELLRGSEDDCEIGSMAGERRPVRLDGLIAKIEEYMPFGRLPTLIMEH